MEAAGAIGDDASEAKRGIKMLWRPAFAVKKSPSNTRGPNRTQGFSAVYAASNRYSKLLLLAVPCCSRVINNIVRKGSSHRFNHGVRGWMLRRKHAVRIAVPTGAMIPKATRQRARTDNHVVADDGGLVSGKPGHVDHG